MKRGQEVWVKVLSMAGSRLSLSMRDVDQETGKDLLPSARTGGAAGSTQRPGGVSGLHGLSGIRVQACCQSCVQCQCHCSAWLSTTLCLHP